MKELVPAVLLLAATVTALAWLGHQPVHSIQKPVIENRVHRTAAAPPSALLIKAEEAKAFAAKSGFNGDVCFLIDMSLPSGSNRFFVYDLRRDSIRRSGLVTHGNCNQRWLEGRQFDNTVGCGCTSLGKYRVGGAYTGRFGLAYKLFGLETTNSNAFDRYVVLHSHSCVPAGEIPDDICQSNGCPTVSPTFLTYLDSIIKRSKKPVLLWIYS